MTPTQRAKKAKKAFDLFEQAYVLCEEIMDNDPEIDQYSLVIPMLETHTAIRKIRNKYEREAEEAKRRV